MRIEALKKLVRNVIAAPAIEQYAARMVRATQPANSKFVSDSPKAVHEETVNRYVMFGSSPRGAQALILGGKVRALLDGRANVAREDIEAIAPSSLSHRIMLNYAAHSDGIDGSHIVERVVRSIHSARPA
jgi:MoxR-like ATPase